MKRAIIFGVLSAAVSICWATDAMPLEQQVATIDAGRYIPSADSSVQRAKYLLSSTAKIYRISQAQAADVAAKGKEIIMKSGVEVGIMDILDGALTLCEMSCSLDELRSFVSYYATIRQTTKQSHQQAIHGLVVLNYMAESMSKPRRK